jgi:hypothetical protein
MHLLQPLQRPENYMNTYMARSLHLPLYAFRWVGLLGSMLSCTIVLEGFEAL